MTGSGNNASPCYRFADLMLDVSRRRVTRSGRPIELSGLNFDLLLTLVVSAPNVVTYDDLAEKVWGRHFVSPENVAQRVMLLRQALSDDATRPRYVEAVRSRGYRLIPGVTELSIQHDESEERHSRNWSRLGEYLLIGILTVGVAWLAYRVELGPGSNVITATDVLPNSVAVLPLENLSPEPDKVYVAGGLHEEILNQIQKVRDLNVIAANSVLPYADSSLSIAEIAKTLRVQSIMTGSVRFADERIRVTVVLVDTQTGTELWSNTYDREFDDIFAIESDIARSVARELEVELSPDEQDQLLRGVSTGSFEAYELYLAARGFGRKGFLQYPRSLELLDRALSIDRSFVDAWLAKANIHSIRAGLIAEGAIVEQQAAIEAAARAIELDSDSWRPHAIMSFILANQGEWLRAEAERRRALELGMPVTQRADSGILMADVGDFAAAREVLEANLKVDPMNSIGAGFLLAMQELAGDSAARRAGYARGEELYGDWLGDAIELLLRLGDRDNAFLRQQDFSADTPYVAASDRLIHVTGQQFIDAPETGLESLRELYGKESNLSAGSLIRMAAWAAYFDDPELALRMISDAVEQQPSRVFYVWLPVFKDARRLSGFEDLIRNLELDEYWRENGWPAFCRAVDAHDFECR